MIILKLKSSCLKQEIFVRRHLLSLLCKIIFNFIFMTPSKKRRDEREGGGQFNYNLKRNVHNVYDELKGSPRYTKVNCKKVKKKVKVGEQEDHKFMWYSL